MRLRALQMSTAAWLLLAAVLMAGTLGRTIRLPRPADGVTWRATPSTVVVQRTARAAHRTAIAPTPSGRRRSKVADRAEERKAAALLLLLMLGRDRFATVPR
ncbi:MAG: hypothetical protein ACREQL_12980 [Candidatus Binatia bacterium]